MAKNSDTDWRNNDRTPVKYIGGSTIQLEIHFFCDGITNAVIIL